MSIRRILAVALCIGLIEASSADAEGFVEGHVFNLRTGVPVANAQVPLVPSVPLRPHGCDSCASRLLLALTDESGFYSIHLSDAEVDLLIAANVTIAAFCPTAAGLVRTGQTAAVDVRDGTVRRDLYLKLPRRPLVQTCLDLSSEMP